MSDQELDQVMPVELAGNRLELRVVQGIHAGAVLPLAGDSIRIGSDENCDVVLLDSGVLPFHLNLISNDKRWCLETEGYEVIPGKAIQVGTAAIAIFEVTDPWLALEQMGLAERDPIFASDVSDSENLVNNGGSKKILPKARPIALIATLLSLVFCIFITLTLEFWIGPIFNKSEVTDYKLNLDTLLINDSSSITKINTGEKAVELTSSSIQLDGVADPKSLELEAIRIFSQHDLVNSADIQATQGHLKIKAYIGQLKLQNFETALKILGKRVGNQVTIDATVINPEQSLPFVLREVILNPISPHIILSNGKRLQEGQTLDGVTLVNIEPGNLTFQGKRRIEVQW